MSLRLVFMGTPDFAVPTLTALSAAGHDIAAVYTRAPAASGRGLKARISPVHAAAEARGLRVETPKSLRDEGALSTLRAFRPDVAVVVAYGLLLPQAALDIPRLGCLNLHASLLPRWRGAAPIQRAVMAGDAETGIAVMRMEAGLDTGPIGAEARRPIGPDESAGDLHDALARIGADLLVASLPAFEAGLLPFRAQVEDGVLYARKITNEEARIDWARPAAEIHDLVRGLSPFPGAFFETDLGRGRERIKVLRACPAAGEGPAGTLLDGTGAVACGTGALRPLTVQRSGKGPMSAEDFWRGVRLEPGTALL